MSGSDYTQTPNYHLYKPTVNADGDAWGNHWNLNADTLDALLGPGGSLPFLPLSGVTPMTGPLTLSANATQPMHAVPLQQINTAAAGGPFLPLPGVTPMTGPLNVAFNPPPGGTFFNVTGNLGGVLNTPNPSFAVNNFAINGDNLNTTTSGPGGADYLYVGGTASAGFTGNRNAIHGFLYVGGVSGNASGASFYSAVAGQASAGAADASPSNNGILGGYFDCTLGAGATGWNGMAGIEVDISTVAGSSVKYRTGINLVIASASAVQGSLQDTGINIIGGAGNTAPLKMAFSLGGPNGIWPVAATGTILGTLSTAMSGPSYAAAYGIDLRAVTFATAAFASNGFSVAQNGTVTAGGGIINGQTELGKTGNDTILGSQAGNTPTATQGFLIIPYCGGTPTGVPANGTKGIAMQYDVSSHKLWAYEGGAWRSVLFA